MCSATKHESILSKSEERRPKIGSQKCDESKVCQSFQAAKMGFSVGIMVESPPSSDCWIVYEML
jgi:hypothetical protein